METKNVNDNVALYNAMLEYDIFESKKHLHDFNFISATVGKLLPVLPFEEHLNIARQCAFNQMLANRDLADLNLIRNVKKPNIDFTGQILVTFHYSSYRIFSAMLIGWGIPYKLVTDNNYIQTQGEKTLESYHSIAQELGVKPHNFEIINAEDRTMMLKCMEAVRQGYTLVFYADGNSGVGGMTKEQANMVKIPFLESEITVRKGISVLASILKVPLTTVTVNRSIYNDNVSLSIISDIPFPKDRKNDDDILQCTKAIYRNLEEQLRQEPGAWEGWFYYHNFIDFEMESTHIKEDKGTLFNHSCFGIGAIANRVHYIMNKKKLLLIPIEEQLFDMLLDLIKTDKVDETLPVVQALRAEGILNINTAGAMLGIS